MSKDTAFWKYDKDAIDWNIGGWCCSECGCRNANLGREPDENPMKWSGSKYCPNCGRKIVGVK